MTSPPVRLICHRDKLFPEERLAAFKNAAGQYLLGCVMVGINLVVAFDGEAFVVYFLPIIIMFVLAWALSLTRRLLWPRDAVRDEGLAALMAYGCILLCVFFRRDLVFSQRLLGTWHITNIFSKFTVIHLAGLIVAAFMIPRDDCWGAFRVAALLAGTCIIGVGMPGGEAADHARYVEYLGLVSALCLFLVNLDVARCFRTWSETSPHAALRSPGRTFAGASFACFFLTPFYLLSKAPGLCSAVWRAQVLWLSGWPAPPVPESYDPRFLRLAHSAPLRQPGVRRLAAALSQASIFALALVAYPPAGGANPYLVFAAELLAPPLVQLLALALVHGPFLVEMDELSRPTRKGAP